MNQDSVLIVVLSLFLTYSLPKIIELMVKKFGEPKMNLDTANIKNALDLYDKLSEKHLILEKKYEDLEAKYEKSRDEYDELEKKYYALEKKYYIMEHSAKQLEKENIILKGDI